MSPMSRPSKNAGNCTSVLSSDGTIVHKNTSRFTPFKSKSRSSHNNGNKSQLDTVDQRQDDNEIASSLTGAGPSSSKELKLSLDSFAARQKASRHNSVRIPNIDSKADPNKASLRTDKESSFWGDFTSFICCGDTRQFTDEPETSSVVSIASSSQNTIPLESEDAFLLEKARRDCMPMPKHLQTKNSKDASIHQISQNQKLHHAHSENNTAMPAQQQPQSKELSSSSLTRNQNEYDTNGDNNNNNNRSSICSDNHKVSILSSDSAIPKYIHGPSKSFLNVNQSEDPADFEVYNTYSKFRMDDDHWINTVLSDINTSLPLYHNNTCGTSTTVTTSSSTKIKHMVSEPISSNFHIRTKSYISDGCKAPSQETLFTLLGADNIVRAKKHENNTPLRNSAIAPDSYFRRLQSACARHAVQTPFLFIINFVVPWGNLLSYYYRPDAIHNSPFCTTDFENSSAAEKLFKSFLDGDEVYRNERLKFIPNIFVGPWFLKKMVGNQPAIIGQKLPTTYYGSIDDGYLEVCLDVTSGGAMANSICNAVASKASIVTVDLAFVLEGKDEKELPEHLLSVIRLHHVKLKKIDD